MPRLANRLSVLVIVLWTCCDAWSQPTDSVEMECIEATRQGRRNFNPNSALERCVRAAESGSIESEYQVALLFIGGLTKEGQDFKKAMQWLRMAAVKNHSGAQFQLANMVFDGLGITADPSGAVMWMKAAANNGHPLAQRDEQGFRRAIERGLGDPSVFGEIADWYAMNGNDIAAFRWYKRAADRGDAEAQTNIGVMALSGYGTSRNSKLAILYLKQAADQNQPEALYELGLVYDRGIGVEANPPLAIAYFTRAAEFDEPRALAALATKHYFGRGVPRNVPLAIDFWSRSAQRNYAPAQFTLGRLYLEDVDVPRNLTTARDWLTKSAEAGYADAQIALSDLYIQGELGPPDFAIARMWLQRAIKNNSAEAMVKLGQLLLRGNPESVAISEAKELFTRAAQAALRGGFLALAELYQSDRLGMMSLEQAYMWANLGVGRFPVTQDWKRAVALRREVSENLDERSKQRAIRAGILWMKEQFPQFYGEGAPATGQSVK